MSLLTTNDASGSFEPETVNIKLEIKNRKQSECFLNAISNFLDF